MAKGWRKWQWETLLDDVRANCQIQPNGCWIWQGGTDKDGYPKLSIDGKDWRGNRAVLKAVTGILGDEGMHSCDTPPCMCPDHLSWGTTSENSIDAVRKGRRSTNFRPMAGETNGRSKLTDKQRDEIVRRSRAGEGSTALALAYGVSTNAIRAVLKQRGASRPTGRPPTRASA